MRFKLAIILILIIPDIMKSQNATATIQNALSCSGDTVLVAVDVTNFIDVAAMTLYIGYDTNAAEFISLQNVHPAVTGFLTTNATNGQIGIAYSNIIAFTINSGKLFDIRFSFTGDSTGLPFNPGTEIANSNLEIIPLDTYAGSISTGLVIISQPDSVQAYPDNDVMFNITTTGNMTYQWQENSGNGWASLQNNQTYAGVNNDTLDIFDVPLSFNGNTYRCLITSGNCSDTSGTGLLEVATAYPAATLGSILSCPENQVLEPLFAGDLFDMVEFTFNISYDTSNLEFQGIENINALLQNDPITITPMTSPPGISLHWEGTLPVTINSGKLFDLDFIYHSQNNTLVFEAGTEVLNSLFNPINMTLTNGHINQQILPQITQHPQYIVVTEGDDALFNVTATGATAYRWQYSTNGGNDWTNVPDEPPYYNVETQELTIDPVSLEMDDYYYSCVVGNDFCTVVSNWAKLDVDSLMLIDQVSGTMPGLRIMPNPFSNYLELIPGGEYDEMSINLYSAIGQLVYSTVVNDRCEQLIRINVPEIPNGLYLLTVTGTIETDKIIQTKKIIKTN